MPGHRGRQEVRMVPDDWRSCARHPCFQSAHQSARGREDRLVGVDVSQSITRASTTVRLNNVIVSPTILPGSLLWLSFEREFGGDVEHVHRPLTGAEALMLQGWQIFNPKWATLLHGDTRQTVPELGRECLFRNSNHGSCVCIAVWSGRCSQAGH